MYLVWESARASGVGQLPCMIKLDYYCRVYCYRYRYRYHYHYLPLFCADCSGQTALTLCYLQLLALRIPSDYQALL